MILIMVKLEFSFRLFSKKFKKTRLTFAKLDCSYMIFKAIKM